jgi:hypothetical protein
MYNSRAVTSAKSTLLIVKRAIKTMTKCPNSLDNGLMAWSAEFTTEERGCS